MSSNFIYSVGLNNVGSYQVSGRPYCANGTLSANTASYSFPQVTKEIVVLNLSGSTDLTVYFHSASTPANQYTVAGGEQQTFTVKCKQVYLSSSATTDYSICLFNWHTC